MKLNIVGYSIYKTKEKKPDDLLLKIDSLEIESGHVNVIKSVSGLGKTTFLNAISGQNQCAEGKIKLDGEEIVYNQSFFKDQCSYVTSDGCFLSDLTVLEQFSLVSKNQDDIDYLLNRFSMKSFLKKKISSLSRGEQKRVEVATAILKNCPLLILDEPTANLDKENSIAIFDAIEEYAINHIVIIASHESEIIKDSFEVYRIENQKLILSKPAHVDEKIDAHNYSSPLSEKNNALVKLALRKSIKNKVSFFLASLFSLVFLCCSFMSLSFGEINRSGTLRSSIEAIPYDFMMVQGIAESRDNNDEQGVFSTTEFKVSTALGYSMNVTTLEDLDGKPKAECEKIFSSFVSPYQDEKICYYPVIITKKQQEMFQNADVSLSIGDILPAEIDDCSYAVPHSDITDQFVVAGIIDIDEEENGSLSSLFPCIIRQEDYFSCLRNTGIRCRTINQSILNLLTEYREYCASNQEECLIEEKDEEKFALSQLVPYSSVKNLMREYQDEEYPYNDKNIYYVGDLPEQKNWMMLPDDGGVIQSFYRALQESDFFKKYTVDSNIQLPLTDHYQALNLSDQETFCIKGLYYRNDKSLTMKDCVIISDQLFSSMLDAIASSPHHKDYISSYTTFASKEWMKNNTELLIEHPESIVGSQTWNQVIRSFDNLMRTKVMVVVLTIISSILSLLFVTIYIFNLRSSFTVDFAVLSLLGCSRKEKRTCFAVSLLPVILLSYLCNLFISQIITYSLISFVAKSSGFIGTVILSSNLVPYLLQICITIVVFALAYILSFLGKKKKSAVLIKEKS